MARRVPLFYLAHARAGDKGNHSSVSLIPYRREDYALLAEQITADAAKRHFGSLVRGRALRYDLPKLGAFNFLFEDALEGGVNDSLALDTHGKARSSLLLGLEVTVPDDHPCLARIANR
jgi:hypothetical protein